MTDGQAYRVFLSYGLGDKWLTKDVIRHKLEEIDGVEVFMDVLNIEFGDPIRDKIIQELKNSDELLVVLTPTSIKRAWIFAEIGLALAEEKRIVGFINGVESDELQDKGILSLFGDRRHIFQPETELDSYLEQVRQRAQAKVSGS